MTTNKLEVVAWYFPNSKMTLPVVSLSAGNGNGQPLIRLSDYEALQAELEREIQRRFYGNRAASREHREEVTELIESLARCRQQASYTIEGVEALQNQLNKIREIANKAIVAYRKGEEV